jgi:hypothetical protein
MTTKSLLRIIVSDWVTRAFIILYPNENSRRIISEPIITQGINSHSFDCTHVTIFFFFSVKFVFSFNHLFQLAIRILKDVQ